MNYRPPIYMQLRDSIIKKIEDGDYLPDEMIPSEREMAQLYDINRMTVKNAIEVLVKDGYLYRIQGKGTFVRGKKNKLLLGTAGSEANYGISARAKKAGMSASSKVIFHGFVQGYPTLSQRLRLDVADQIFALHRVRYGDEEPLAIEYTYIPGALFEDADLNDYGQVSLYDYMNNKNHMPVEFGQRLMVVGCPQREAGQLEIEPRTAVFCFEYTGRERSGRIVEFTRTYIRTDKTNFRFSSYRSD